ncbi:hypothetical protein HUW51_10180 [Adhaeribacter swui]|uniref:Uncharacterized protein n=1 Tax=Adhaeribacter swui TaxID=2086471 RepID=A0A7G7G7E5_9BACT|nr:hypothetical protein [Adhaeribacter swui]QNF33079.1 hypothetical protein HUW51_10180 [Adhaeribacter swui]
MQINSQNNAPAFNRAEHTIASPNPNGHLYSEQPLGLEIDCSCNYLLYNATAMAHQCGQNLALFLSLPQTKEVIAAHLANEKLYQILRLNSGLAWFIEPEDKLDLVLQSRAGIVWVNALLALRLALYLGSVPLQTWVLATRNTIKAEIRKNRRLPDQAPACNYFGVPSPTTHQSLGARIIKPKSTSKVLAPVGHWRLLPGQKFTANQPAS